MNERGQLAPTFASLPDGTGLEVVDPMTRRQFSLYTSTPVRPAPTDEDPFRAPVDSTAKFTTGRVDLPEIVDVFVRDGSGEVVVEPRPGTETELPDGEYHIELNAPIKIYLGVVGPLGVAADVGGVSFELGCRSEVLVGARSYHERPVVTITTPERPRDVMTAFSYLGSALKTTSSERSYPTLRAHPPAVERGSALHVPDGLERPDTGVRLELPVDYESTFVAAPLAYYLGAELVPGDAPRIATESEFAYPLGDPGRGFERNVERVLKQTFFLDCLTRTEGDYRVRLHEREAVEPLVDLDFERLHGQPLERRLERYLDVPFDVLEEYVPRWALTAHVPPTAEQIEAIPYLVNDLAVVRTPTDRELSASEIRGRVLDGYFEDGGRGSAPSGSELRSGGRSDRPAKRLPVVDVAETGSLDDAWLGDGVPLGATKAIPGAFRNRFEQPPLEGSIDIAVVCNARGMESEGDVASEVYGARDELPFDVTLHRNLAADELRELFAADVDFLHYIGHVSERGFHCTDGAVDAATVDGVNFGSFFLNACESYRQGIRLIEAGSVGGVVTISEVNSSSAARLGRTMARLLNLGFPLRTALTLAREESIVGGHYIVVGDGNVEITSARHGAPQLSDVAETETGDYELTIRTYLPRGVGMGTLVYPALDANDRYHLMPGAIPPFRLDEDALRRYLTWHPFPVRKDGRLVWNETAEAIEL